MNHSHEVLSCTAASPNITNGPTASFADDHRLFLFCIALRCALFGGYPTGPGSVNHSGLLLVSFSLRAGSAPIRTHLAVEIASSKYTTFSVFEAIAITGVPPSNAADLISSRLLLVDPIMIPSQLPDGFRYLSHAPIAARIARFVFDTPVDSDASATF